MLVFDARPLFARERRALLDLLGSLDVAEWSALTVCPGWAVRDVVAHLLDDYLRRLSGSRDGYGGVPFAPGESLPAYLARINGEFVTAMRQCSPSTMVDLLAHLGPQLDDLWERTDPTGPAYLDVSWAGSGTSPAWLDCAREYTEFWVHQQQIRDAVGRPGADEPELLRPVVVTFLHALPVALSGSVRPAGTEMSFEVTGSAGGRWVAVSDGTGWGLLDRVGPDPAAAVRMDADTVWRLGSRGITVGEARRRAKATGDPELTAAATTLLAVVA
ncbi:maleylpyruvate isomerase family mycothiol-dependent enzyme [Nocardia carnea]|uniref:Maleylpyruvate isomerase family mycothiol-dependent enzyme n=1 Tax=Nocardia carnea TaxID=37328 RepID=A0ABW7TNJ8_9NOCA|nr:maleylpyruvate isomerase family mycothiol-dependent enzyme [Nocardia carnea]